MEKFSISAELFVSVVYKSDFDKVKSEFAVLFDSIARMVEKAHVSLDNLKEFLAYYDDLEAPLQHANTIAKVMRVIQQHSSFINCVYLEYVVERFSITAAKMKIDTYYKFVEKFCKKKLTQHSYMTPFFANQSRHLLSSETITFKLEWTPSKKTLSDIQSLLSKTFKSLSSHIHIVVVGGGCVTVICYAPQYLMGALVKLAQENMKVLVESSVTYLSVGYAVLLDNSALKKGNTHIVSVLALINNTNGQNFCHD